MRLLLNYKFISYGYVHIIIKYNFTQLKFPRLCLAVGSYIILQFIPLYMNATKLIGEGKLYARVTFSWQEEGRNLPPPPLILFILTSSTIQIIYFQS